MSKVISYSQTVMKGVITIIPTFTVNIMGAEEITEYTVYFKYYIVDDVLTCFFDSVEYGEKHTEEKDQVKTYWKNTLAANKNYLMNTGGNYYVNVDFLENEIPNFGK